MLGMTFSMPIRATWTGGVEVDRPALPSFSTTTIVPVSAMAKLTARDAHVGLEILLAEVSPGDVGQRAVLGGERLAELLGEQLAARRRPTGAWRA